MRPSARKMQDVFFRVIMTSAMACVVAVFFLLVAIVFVKGMSSLHPDMLLKTTEGGYYIGKSGGILNAIAGSLLLASGATLIAALIGIPVVFYLNIYLKRTSSVALALRIVMDVLWGVPSIVYGAFGFTIMVALGMKTSLLAGMITVSAVILPIVTRGLDESLRMMPRDLVDASSALGATTWETATRVVFRQAIPAIVSALLVAFGRAMGDAASVLFTAGFSDSMPYSPFKPVATLPLAIFFQIGTPFPEVQERGYASAFILTVILLAVSIAARLVSQRFHRNIVD